MTGWLPRSLAQRWIEGLLALAVFGGLVWAIRSIFVNGYLPQPFFYEPADVWMDWFNTAYWAHDKGTYDTWQTVYPPLSFVFLKPLGLQACYYLPGVASGEGWPTRDCDWLGAIVMHGIFVLNVFLIGLTFLKIDRRTALFRSFIVAAGMPMLDALERGNLMMITFTCFLLAHGPLLRSARLRWLFAGLAINFKVYLIASIVPYILRRRWRWFEGALLATVLVYLVTWGLLGRGTPLEIYDNITQFAGNSQSVALTDLWYSVTYLPLRSLLTGAGAPSTIFFGSQVVETGGLLLAALTLTVQTTILAAAAAAALRPEAVTTTRVVNLGVSLALITAEAGGYTQVIIVFLTLMERWRGPGRIWAILACYALCFPGDIYIAPLAYGQRPGFLYSAPVYYAYWITVGPFLRPLLIMSIPFALSCVTIRQVWNDIRAQGWRGRTRFARDLPIMLAGGRTA